MFLEVPLRKDAADLNAETTKRTREKARVQLEATPSGVARPCSTTRAALCVAQDAAGKPLQNCLIWANGECFCHLFRANQSPSSARNPVPQLALCSPLGSSSFRPAKRAANLALHTYTDKTTRIQHPTSTSTLLGRRLGAAPLLLDIASVVLLGVGVEEALAALGRASSARLPAVRMLAKVVVAARGERQAADVADVDLARRASHLGRERRAHVNQGVPSERRRGTQTLAQNRRVRTYAVAALDLEEGHMALGALAEQLLRHALLTAFAQWKARQGAGPLGDASGAKTHLGGIPCSAYMACWRCSLSAATRSGQRWSGKLSR